MLRQVLAGYSGVAPGELAFRREPCPRCGGPSGRPALVPAHQAPSAPGAHRPAPAPGSRAGAMPWFSLAHSGDMVLIAVAGRPVGADVEREAAGCVCSLAGVLHEADATVLAGLVEPERHEAVITCWVRAEAVLKCTGEGIAHGLGEFPVWLAGADASSVHGCAVRDLSAPPGYRAAIALAGTCQITLRAAAGPPPAH